MGRPQVKIILEVVRPNKIATFETGKISWNGNAHNLLSRGAWLEILTKLHCSDWVSPSKFQDSDLNNIKTSSFASFAISPSLYQKFNNSLYAFNLN